MGHAVFGNRREIHQWLYAKFLSLLDERQRAAVEEAIAGELDAGEVTTAEVEYALTRALRRLRDDHTISVFEYEKLIAALRERAG